ncbi:hypothetical protein FGB62_1g661 [Gracilaria domingensis]|nr:hypothetical protein FGB62_1g661 [Gracilaria domingensis]
MHRAATRGANGHKPAVGEPARHPQLEVGHASAPHRVQGAARERQRQAGAQALLRDDGAGALSRGAHDMGDDERERVVGKVEQTHGGAARALCGRGGGCVERVAGFDRTLAFTRGRTRHAGRRSAGGSGNEKVGREGGGDAASTQRFKRRHRGGRAGGEGQRGQGGSAGRGRRGAGGGTSCGAARRGAARRGADGGATSARRRGRWGRARRH